MGGARDVHQLLFKQPIAALLTTFGVFFVLWLVSFVGGLLRAKAMIDLARATGESPSCRPCTGTSTCTRTRYDTMLLSADAGKVFTGLAVLLGFVVVATAAGSFVFAKRDI